jgi:uncharacterized protein
MKKKYIFLILILLLGVFLYFSNNFITMTTINYKSDKLPQSFKGYKVIHLSDLHGKSFGRDQERLVGKVKDRKPDIIVYTGDLVDSSNKNYDSGITLMRELVKVAPVYYVTGNHEWWGIDYEYLKAELKELGVRILNNRSEALKAGNDRISIIGVDDPASGSKLKFTSELSKFREDGENFKILLSHRPELFNLYADYKFDLTLSGHNHGGQFRLPFLGGVIGPDRGLFPQYTSGIYHEGKYSMVVSRGLGNSIIPLRLFNPPEVVEIILNGEN